MKMASSEELIANNTFQATFDPLRIFAFAKLHIASSAPERGR